MDRIDDFKTILGARLKVYRKLRLTLEKATDNKHGTVWGLDRMESINDCFAELKKLDDRQARVEIDNEAFTENRSLALLANDLKNNMSKVKSLLILFQIRLEGAKQNISMNMKKAVKGKRIKGYKMGGESTSESKICVC